jgi:hypothetical protein
VACGRRNDFVALRQLLWPAAAEFPEFVADAEDAHVARAVFFVAPGVFERALEHDRGECCLEVFVKAGRGGDFGGQPGAEESRSDEHRIDAAETIDD